MDGSIHIRNKNNNALISKDVTNLIRRHSTPLPLAPLISEDIISLRLQVQRDQEEQKEKERQNQVRRKQDQEINRKHISILRQEYYMTHSRTTQFDPDWTPESVNIPSISA
jgi:hypothetical protein